MNLFGDICPCILTCSHARVCNRKVKEWSDCGRIQEEVEKWAMLKRESRESAMDVANTKSADSGFIFKANG